MGNNNDLAREQKHRQQQTHGARIASSVTLAVSMTNEELAVQIQLGHTELYGELWRNCRKLLCFILTRYQKRLNLPNFVSADDLEQCLYFALRAAVNSYDSGKPYKFSTYLNYSVMNAANSLLPDKRIIETSANQTVSEDEADGAELIDFIEDETAAIQFENIELQELREQVRRAVANLPDDSRVCIDLNYFQGMTHNEVAALTGLTVYEVRGAISRGLYILRKNKALRELYK